MTLGNQNDGEGSGWSSVSIFQFQAQKGFHPIGCRLADWDRVVGRGGTGGVADQGRGGVDF